MKILIKGNPIIVNRTYDKIFSICDKYSTLFKVCTEDEYDTELGYIVVIKSISPEAEEEINNIRNVEIYR